MDLNNLLFEATYDLSFFGKLYKYIQQNLYTKSQHLPDIKKEVDNRSYAEKRNHPDKKKMETVHQKQILRLDITNFIPNHLNPKNRKLYFVYKLDLNPENHESSTDVNFKNGYCWINFVRDDKFEAYDTVQQRDIFKHELIHAIDYLKDTDTHYQLYQSSLKKGKKENRIRTIDKTFSSDSGALSYVSNKMETNVAVNLLKDYKERNPKKWMHITKYEDLIRVIFHISNFDEYDKDTLKSVQLKKSLLARLNRENLIPPFLKV